MAKTTTIGLDELNQDPDNARRRDKRAKGAIKASLEHFGAGRSIVVDGDNTIRAGNGTAEQAAELGIERVIVVEPEPGEIVAVKRSDWTEDEAKAYGVADNKTTDLSRFDDGALAAVLKSVPGIPPEAMGYDKRELVSFLASVSKKEVEEDEAPEPPAVAVTKPGDVWELGRHRVVCGDCTDAANYPEMCNLGLTDPPYGVGEDYASHDDTEQALRVLSSGFFELARSRCEALVFTPGVTRQWYYPEPDWVMCWFFGGGQHSGPWGFSCWQPILAYGKDRSLSAGRGRRPDAVNLNTPANAKDIDHPCPKPMQLWQWLIERCSVAGESILDPFLGSGTTMIAAEQLDRTCYGIEIEPRYVDVIVERWENLTGGKAKRASA